ncbi:cation transporter [Nocardioides ganghwensis]|uniref:Cation transporter n=2 Tax=Nocardioides ganghwensis TaxID=252230 RepID=A0A4Q2SFV6_9ACTN|nr:cation transporter [Nocardioides ganghwensis]RYC02416.1 cation transporter [Nocardioides ganghwensis]
MTSAVAVVFATAGSSQAMKTAWVEDTLALVPPLAFLVAVRFGRRRPDADHPYGFHRSTGVGHLTAAVALLAVGLLLAVESAMGLVRAEHPPIGTVHLLGQTFWAGWLMVGAMVYTGIGPFVLGRMKLPLAEELHDKVLYADADMQKADWMTAAGTIAGVLGIGVGLWWADSGVALLISLSIVHDGWTNLRHATSALMDERARTYDDERPHPLTRQVDEALTNLSWVEDSRSRVRDQGHVFHVEAFVRPSASHTPTLEQLEAAVSVLRDLDWKIHDVVVMPVRDLPDTIPAPD